MLCVCQLCIVGLVLDFLGFDFFAVGRLFRTDQCAAGPLSVILRSFMTDPCHCEQNPLKHKGSAVWTLGLHLLSPISRSVHDEPRRS